MDINFKLDGADKFLKKLDEISNTNLKATMQSACYAVEASAKGLVPADTGALKASITNRVYLKNNNVVGKIYSIYEYANYVEFGTGVKGSGTYPYKIEGLNLSYKNESWVYFNEKLQTFLRTNGYVARPFMYPALKNNEIKIKNMFKQEIINAMKGK